MWIETQANELVNLDTLKAITTKVRAQNVDIIGKQENGSTILATLRTQEEAMKFLRRLMKEGESGKKFVSSYSITISIENEE